MFFDIGANVGAYSLVAAKFLQGRVKCYSFEPGFSSYKQLCKNVYVNNCQSCITPMPIALSDETMLSKFNYSSLMEGDASHAFGESIDYLGNPFQPIFKQTMLGFKIDELVKHLEIPNFIKIDIDGIELKVLRGADNTLSNPLVKSILVEVVEGMSGTKEIVDYLNEKGFKVESKNKYSYGISPSSNYIFVRK